MEFNVKVHLIRPRWKRRRLTQQHLEKFYVTYTTERIPNGLTWKLSPVCEESKRSYYFLVYNLGSCREPRSRHYLGRLYLCPYHMYIWIDLSHPWLQGNRKYKQSTHLPLILEESQSLSEGRKRLWYDWFPFLTTHLIERFIAFLWHWHEITASFRKRNWNITIRQNGNVSQ